MLFVYSDGTRSTTKDNNKILHCVDGPALINGWGDKFYYINGQPHRENGPACEYASGSKVWFYKGKYLNVSSQEEFEKLLRLKPFW